MADNKAIDGLDAATTAALTDLIVLLVSGLSKKMTLTNLKTVLGIPHRGALVKPDADITTVNASAGYEIVHDAEDYDTDSIHSNSVNNTRLTVPSGVTKVRLSANVHIDALSASKYAIHLITKGGSGDYTGVAQIATKTTLGEERSNISTAILTVTSGDYFEQKITVETDTSVTVTAARTWFAMEIIE